MKLLPGLRDFLMAVLLVHILGLWGYGLWAWPVGTAIIAALILLVLLRYWPEERAR